jgi:ankyrin repeat protein
MAQPVQISGANQQQRSPLEAACEAGDEGLAKQLLAQNRPSEDDLKYALRIASGHGLSSLVSLLLSNGASPDRSAIEGALHSSNTLSVFQAFFEAGWDVNFHLGHMHDALYFAASTDDVELIQWLLEHGADPNANNDLPSLSTLAEAATEASTNVVGLLLEHGASLHQSDALQAAARAGRVDMIEYLLGKGADINEVIEDKWGYAHSKLDEKVGTALHQAAAYGKRDAVMLLLEKGADMTIKDEKGRTALQVVQEAEQKDTMDILAVHE